ncbi:hypothetical protein CC1G_09486 [Coprinopsis cinerea okayama7|uniref:Uncharacterized protein n=1 Tax=Coprinopsis cinerea (strain Okayama-7 / 130 / ATCC MYA-4618 / FGSC 9003) TaxID=240176 RepID=A8PDH6_COPC7|nr:hypothetical protein CC1G_09486 [Coprinopsis cinerea okayama7\|eukprot:XP_001840602.2 hypothetical protein CC1G_09486 [Coprinopsis cinerea okayama7\
MTQELVKLIVAHHYYRLSEDTPFQAARRQLRSLTAISRTFFEATSDLLWEEVDTLLPFLKLLPQLEATDNLYILNRTVVLEDLDRWNLYSRRTRKITFDASIVTKRFCSQIFTLLATLQTSHGFLLFPALKKLIFKGGMDDNDLACLFMLASSELEHVRFKGEEATLPMEYLPISVNHLSTVSPRLKTLVIEVSSSNLHDFPWDTLKTFHHLQTLNITAPFHLRGLTAIPNFRGTRLYLCVFPNSQPSPRIVVHYNARERPITTLMLAPWEVLPTYIGLCGPPFNTEHLHFGPMESPTSHRTEWSGVLSSIAEKGDNLDMIQIGIEGMPTEFFIPVEDVSSLLALRNLQRFSVQGCGNSFATHVEADNYFQRMLQVSQKKAKPLISLMISSWSGAPLTLNSLVHISVDGPSLSRVVLSIDSSLDHIPPPASSSLSTALEQGPVSSLQALVIMDTRSRKFAPDECRELARLLDRLFPELSRIAIQEPPPSDVAENVKEGWKLVEELREQYRRLRRSSLPPPQSP